ncbi:hypothetical protein PsalN5692_03758 (plasmid) [Piscirickettsia salmonis]|nr:hypothetical protein PsalN5692_03758 [Piscirickettsia salmonis]QGP57386.1 hypothetical protein PsalSR1_04875 [Piscirickettsia salmonis]QGP66981.1 hypothetical protein PsalMR5_04906 [Piscirickettsia salmonis]
MCSSKRKIRSSGAIKNAARSANMGKSRPAWSENFLNEFSEECKSRNSKKPDKYQEVRSK